MNNRHRPCQHYLIHMMTAPTKLLWFFLSLSSVGCSSAVIAKEPLPPLPNCMAKATPAVRVQALDQYVTALENWADKTSDFMQQQSARTYVTLVAAHLLPEATPFRRHEQECWMFFEDARRALAKGSSRNARIAAGDWETCLKMRQDNLHAATAPFLRCLR